MKSRTLPLAVKNTGFLLDRLGQDCHPLQFLRELTQNSVEAIGRTGEPGEIVWDYDHKAKELDPSLPFRLTVTDTGDGMTGPEMVDYINQLSSSGSAQSFSGNYGMGAKIAAGTRNPHGLIFQSWKDGAAAPAPEAAFPHVQWVSVEDGTRDAGDIEDRAARFVHERNALLINGDFRGFRDMIDHWLREFDGSAGVRAYIQDAVRNWFEQALVETVIGVQGLRHSKEWNAEDLAAALSDEALTASVMQRYHVANAVKRELGTKLGQLRVSRGGKKAANRRG